MRNITDNMTWFLPTITSLFLIMNSSTTMMIPVSGFNAEVGVFTTTEPSIRHHCLQKRFSIVNNNYLTSLRSTPGDDNEDDDDDDEEQQLEGISASSATNVLGTEMECCCSDVRGTGIGTGFYRNGYCSTGSQDIGRHTVCVQVTNEFLEFSKSAGNDLSTPIPQYNFPGLQDGDRWCLCAQRWTQALKSDAAPKIYLRSTHERTLDYVNFNILRSYALDGDEADTEKEQLNMKRDKLEQIFGQGSDE
jgi:uncharacterized protein (DUF2237 family)